MLERHYVFRGRALRALDHVELDLGAFLEAPMAVGLDRGVMAEDVAAAVVTRDEPEALLIVEPLDRSCRTHRLLLPDFAGRLHYFQPAVCHFSPVRANGLVRHPRAGVI